MSQHPATPNTPITPEDLAACALRELDPQAARRVEDALLASPDLRDGLAHVQSTAALLNQTRLADPPAALVQRALRLVDRKSTRLNSSHLARSRMPSSA